MLALAVCYMWWLSPVRGSDPDKIDRRPTRFLEIMSRIQFGLADRFLARHASTPWRGLRPRDCMTLRRQ